MLTHMGICSAGIVSVGITILFKYSPYQAAYRCFLLELAWLCHIYPGEMQSRIHSQAACHEFYGTEQKNRLGVMQILGSKTKILHQAKSERQKACGAG